MPASRVRAQRDPVPQWNGSTRHAQAASHGRVGRRLLRRPEDRWSSDVLPGWKVRLDQEWPSRYAEPDLTSRVMRPRSQHRFPGGAKAVERLSSWCNRIGADAGRRPDLEERSGGILVRVDLLPTGTVTMLFTDIESSTALLSRLGHRYGEALTAQRSIMREAINSASGAATRWAPRATASSSFSRPPPDGAPRVPGRPARTALHRMPGRMTLELRVRMGVHTGEPIRHEEGYVGMDLNRAARIAATAHGGQVVVSPPNHLSAGGTAAARGRRTGRPRLAPAEGHRPAGADLPAHGAVPAGRLPTAQESGGTVQPAKASDPTAGQGRHPARAASGSRRGRGKTW